MDIVAEASPTPIMSVNLDEIGNSLNSLHASLHLDILGPMSPRSIGRGIGTMINHIDLGTDNSYQDVSNTEGAGASAKAMSPLVGNASVRRYGSTVNV